MLEIKVLSEQTLGRLTIPPKTGQNIPYALNVDFLDDKFYCAWPCTVDAAGGIGIINCILGSSIITDIKSASIYCEFRDDTDTDGPLESALIQEPLTIESYKDAVNKTSKLVGKIPGHLSVDSASCFASVKIGLERTPSHNEDGVLIAFKDPEHFETVLDIFKQNSPSGQDTNTIAEAKAGFSELLERLRKANEESKARL